MFAGGATVTAIGLLAPHAASMDATGYAWLLAAQVAVAIGLLVLPRSLGTAWIPPTVVALSILAVSAAIYFNGERLGGPAMLNELFYVWPALYVGYFFTRSSLLLAVLAIAAAYAGTLGAIDTDRDAALTRWMITVSVAAGAALALHAIRCQVDRLLAQLRELARTDPLTGLANRREFEARFEQELERARRTGKPLALALGDVDFFKRLNDRHGHQAGDEALKRVGRALLETTRSTDLCARIGGEEFAVLLPESTIATALPAIERSRNRLASSSTASGHTLTMSFGLVDFPAGGSSVRELLHAADVALYNAKQGGRDQIAVGPTAVAV